MAHTIRFAISTTRFTIYAAVFQQIRRRALGFFRGHIFKQPDEPAAVKPVVLGPPDDPAPSKPIVPETVRPVQYGITPKRILLPHSDFSAWVVSDPSATLERHSAIKGCADPIFRKACERKNLSPLPKYRFDNSVPNCLLEQTRISILSWNPAPRRGKPGAIEEHIAGKRHTVASQETVEFPQHANEPCRHYALRRLRRPS